MTDQTITSSDVFLKKLSESVDRAGAPLCIGIDPDVERLPGGLGTGTDQVSAIGAFCRGIIEATADHAAAFKFNFAFFEALGWQGVRLLEELVAEVPLNVLTIADAKRGDIGNTARMYADAIYKMGFDSCTLSPYMGHDSVEPFLDTPGTCAFVLARTSNPGGADFQTLISGGEVLYRRVGRTALQWGKGKPATIGLVVGATDLDALEDLRRLCPDTPFLIPGVGAQGGTVRDVMSRAGSGPLLINMSRSILYASRGENYAEAASTAARQAVDDFSHGAG